MSTVKFVELDISASGFGCVNTNGNINPKTGVEGSDDGYKNKIFPKSRGGQLYISNNSIRGYYFANEARGVMLAGKAGFNNNKGKLGELVIGEAEFPKVSQMFASSYLGLMRGYMLTQKGGESIKRKSPLMVTDWVNENELEPNKNEVMVNHLALTDDGKKDKNSLFYAETWGDTNYKSRSIISIENLQFISLDSRLGQKEVDFGINPKKKDVTEDINAFIETLIDNIKAIAIKRNMTTEGISATYGKFTKNDVLFQYIEEGILLSNQAIHTLVTETIDRFKEFQIVKSSGFVKVDNVKTSYSYGLNKVLDELGDATPDYEVFYTLES